MIIVICKTPEYFLFILYSIILNFSPNLNIKGCLRLLLTMMTESTILVIHEILLILLIERFEYNFSLK